ncbi:Bacteriocin helveticin-J [Lactobacillus helveticus CIRM-BIA 101]|uniref:helveticin J family class III bacteriocin n=1 Tax=Lactobacillus helveticus TaxID=1587 RepID=UPI0001B858D7|nr:helveticin J family class III bacteriocin [Lactobacillus helveticus]EEW68007.1 putative bacteriocin helveticin-J [Lactobacillus helveticus DSM 20075 = CGMCC 1.1877]KGL04768.1 bacteriocin [Lactobacillus helveticus]KGL06453.1 bacteriocin [Lactobacillus helveticus]KRL32821.1 bacteriocin helveticin-J [Lactobacillus helveticus DSM 20075 = CGMCC 1.1877]MCT3394032.1 bacteriocin [Lactobacillus helveticus]
MKTLNETTNVNILSQFDLGTGYQAVVQKGNVGSKYVYALQLRGDTTTILRGYRGYNINNSILELSGQAGGHTQTWEFAGNHDDINGNTRAGQWFVGVKPSYNDPKYKWAKQIARVDIRYTSGPHASNTEFPRLAYLNRAGSDPFSGDDMTHAEAAVSPDYTKFLIATIEDGEIGHFTIYDLDTINNALDNAGTGYVSLDGFPYQTSFTISNLYGDGQDNIINSIQGFDLDNNGNIYISSQHYPSLKNGHWSVHHKQIVKIPYYAQSEDAESQWSSVNLSAFGGLDISGKHSEVESIQIIDEDHCYLTVAYHANVYGKNKTVLNKIYELTWD